MTKKLKYSVCALVTTLIACVITVMVLERSERSETVDGIKWYYSISNSKARIGSRNGCAIPISTVGSISIPKVLGGYPVTSIGREAFCGCDRLITVKIPEGVTSIGEKAFARCSELTMVTIPSSVTSIGALAFACCRGLKSVTIPSSVTSIGTFAFSCCSGLKSVTIPWSVMRIWTGMFEGCNGLTSVTISKGVRYIEDAAFRNCSGLMKVTIPEGVISIGDSAFESCSGLKSVTIPSSVTSIGSWAFRGCSGRREFSVGSENAVYCSVNGLLCSKDGKTLLAGVNGDVTIPKGVTSIGGGAFRGCSGLTSVTIPEGVTYIGDEAFSGCNGLMSVEIPESVAIIANRAFDGCDRLDSKSRLAIRKKEDVARREERMNGPAYKILKKWYDMQLDENGWIEVAFHADVDNDFWSLLLQDFSNPTTQITYHRGVGRIEYSRWLSKEFAGRLINARIRMFEIENGIKEKENAH